MYIKHRAQYWAHKGYLVAMVAMQALKAWLWSHMKAPLRRVPHIPNPTGTMFPQVSWEHANSSLPHSLTPPLVSCKPSLLVPLFIHPKKSLIPFLHLHPELEKK